MVTEHWAGSWSLPSSSSPALVSLSPPLSTNCPSRDKAQVAREQGYLCMAADRALDAVGVRGASGGRGYCWPPAAPPHQQVPTWGRPIHEVGAVGRSGGQVERVGGSMPGREGATTSLSLLHSSPSSSSCGGASRGCISSGALYLARSTRTGVASPHHTFPPEPGLQSLSEWQIPTVVLWEGRRKLYSQSLNVATQREVMPLPILGIPNFFYRIGTC